MKALIAACLSHKRSVISTLVLLLIAGAYAYAVIPKEDSPDVNIPILYVNVSHDGISPEDAERLLIKPLETEMRGIEGVKEMRSTAFLGGANVLLEFDAGFDSNRALIDVREKVDLAKPDLPDEADEPVVSEVNLSLFPVLTVTLSGQVPERTLLRLARDLQDRLETIPQVLSANLNGDREERLEIVVDPLMLESYGIDTEELVTYVNRSNLLVAAGELDNGTGRFPVKVPGLFEDYKDVLDLPVLTDGDQVVRFGDLAELRRTFKDSEGFVRVNGQPALALEIQKRTGENIIETIELVREKVEQTRKYWPESVQVNYSQDASTNIRTMLSDLQNNVLSAILLVMVVVVAALGLRSAGLVGVAIPGSFLTGILVIWSMGLTVNVVVLFSLILSVGMLVDGAIVVTEYADRKMNEGEPRGRAYGLAAQRMSWPIIAATATTLAAFLPLVFWPGIVGEFMKYLPITLVATLSASLAMALIFVPTLGALIGRASHSGPAPLSPDATDDEDLANLSGITGYYVRLLRSALKRPGAVLLTALAVLIAAQIAYGTFGKGIEFFPKIEPDNAALQIRAQGNFSIQERDTLLQQVENRILDLQEERGEFHSIYAFSMARSGQQRDEPEDIIGVVQLEFTDWFARRKADVILADIRDRTADLAGIHLETRKEEAGPPVGKPIQIEVGSDSPERIAATAERIAAKLESMDGLLNIEDGGSLPGIEWNLTVDRAQAAKFGADISLIGSYVRMVTNGMIIGGYRPDDSDDEIDIVVRLTERERTVSYLDDLRIQTKQGSIPISNFVTRSAQPKINQLRRVDGQRVVTLRADVAPGVLASEKVAEIQNWMLEQEPDPLVNIRFKGEDEEQQKAQAFLGKAFVVALFLMAIILVTQFNSFYSAFLILTAVVMSTVGVMLGLLLTGQPFGIVMSGIGVIALAGIVVNNNIVLIDTYDRLKETARSDFDAILRTGAQRLRPVLLTSVTTILGLMPMVLALNIDFVARDLQIGAPSTQWWRQLSTAIAFGLAFATLLTLFVTPSALMARAKFKAWRSARKERRQTKRGAANPSPAE
ncbi:efflux RND transporter permease subunit [Limibacillus halophilus]|uniref:Multidrug efflux pump n=1 Tax=Limibacillus halophilus TaxID=1579333 RepID=A0A839SP34_9PROT|nr:efflux RND transporter permease subunit [Limibacillus halophilus]MBB3064657.1 multidrug efflux pump [Limibacillus halophilus]